MVTQSPVDQFSSWKNTLISNLVSKNKDSIEEPEAKEPKLECEIQEKRYESNEGSSTSETRDEAETEGDQEQRTCIEDGKACSPIDERSCVPRTAEEMKMDLKNTQEALAEMVRKRNHIREIEDTLEKNEQKQCVDFSVSCNPEVTASKEECKKPMMERKDDALDYVFNLVEIVICGDKKSNIDEAVTQRPTKKEQMPDPVQLLREKSIFQTLNPGSASKNRRHTSRSHKSRESSDQSKAEDKYSSATEVSNAELGIVAPFDEITTCTKKSVEASTSETFKNKGVSSVAIPTKVSKEEVTKPEVSDASKPEAPKEEASMSQSTKIYEAEEASAVTAKPVSDVSTIHVPPTIPEEPSKSEESFTPEQVLGEKKEAVETVPAETDDFVSVAPQSSVHMDTLQPSISLITDIEDYSNFPPRVIHLSDPEAKAKPTKPSNIYSPNISKLQQNTKKFSSAVAAYNKKPKRGVNFGGSTHVVGKQGSTTTLAKHSDAMNEKIIQLIAGLLSMGHSNDTDAPGTPRGVLLLATVVSFIFWPEGLPKEHVAQQKEQSAVPTPSEEPKKVVPSLLSLVGDAKSKRSLSPMKQNRPRLQFSTRRMNISKKESFGV